jgi:hypothetical protein
MSSILSLGHGQPSKHGRARCSHRWVRGRSRPMAMALGALALAQAPTTVDLTTDRAAQSQVCGRRLEP